MNDSFVAALLKRRTELIDQLEVDCPDVCDNQKFLETGSQEQAYWKHGYQAALKDVLETMSSYRGDDITPGRLH